MIKAALATAALLAAAQPAAAEAAGVQALQAWSRPAAAGTNGVGYLTVVNRGKADSLLSVDCALAEKVELHASRTSGGVMSMTTEDRVPLPARSRVVFAPGGRHLMFVGLTRALHAGDRIPATLHFASGAALKVSFTVGTGAAPAASAQPGMDHMSGMDPSSMPGMAGMH